MNGADDRLEILIGRLLDGELSPAQQRILDRELEQDGRARELLEQFRMLHECGCEIVAREVRQGGADPQEIFERAWRQNKGSVWRRVIRIGGLARFAVGVAAGFLLGLLLHFALVGGSQPSIEVAAESPAETNPGGNTVDRNRVWPVLERSSPQEVTREVEWYGFTDRAGNQWLIEGFREGMAKPASYHGDL